MPATGRNLARRFFLLILAAAPLAADTHQDILDFLGSLAAAISEGNGSAFLDRVDRSTTDYYTLEQYIDALSSLYSVSCSIDVLKEEGDDQSRTLELDWVLQIHPRDGLDNVENRRQTVKAKVERKKKKWKIVALEPITLFAPPAVR